MCMSATQTSTLLHTCMALGLIKSVHTMQGAVAAGMRVVVVPSLTDKAEYPVPEEGCSSGG